MSELWFNKLPSGWVPRRVKTISPVMRGASPRPIDDPIYFDDDGEFAWVRISDVTLSNGRLEQTVQRLSGLGALKSVKLEPGKLFLSIAGSVGKPCITAIKACIHDGFVYFPYLPQTSQKYLYWIFESRECFSGLGKLGTQLNLNTETVGNISIPFPPLDTQKAIADFLDSETARIDQLIEKKQRLMELVKESELAHIAHKFSQLDARTWRARHLGKLRNGAGFPVDLQGDPSQDIAFFKVKHLKVHGLDAAITDTTDTVSEETARSLRATVFPKGTIVFAKIGAALLLGRFSMLGRPACIDNNMSAFVPNERLIEPNFALLGLSQAEMTTMVQPGAVPSLSTEAFYSFGIPLPSKEAQRNFVDEFRSWRATTVQIVGKTQQSIARLQEFRSALITAAVTGQIDVATWGKQGQTDRRLEVIEEAMRA